MKRLIYQVFWALSSLLLIWGCEKPNSNSEPIIQLQFENNITPTYHEIISHYQQLDQASPIAKLIETGTTDAGVPLHLFVIDKNRKFNPESDRKKNKTILFINNGIHPGEPCGIDASLLFADELLRNVNQMQAMLDHVTICIVPVYNTGGCLNRSAYHRANQVGPLECGFRGNARNLDLNRDFVKCNSRNAQSFAKTFTFWNPDILLDTHTTNGSDHQYAITLIPPCPSVFPETMGNFIRNTMLPDLYQAMQETPYEMTPYVSYVNQDPSSGIKMTYESPRFSSGFARVHHCYGFMTENHVYKSYPDRVKSVYHFIKKLYAFSAENYQQITKTRAQGIKQSMESTEQTIKWETDTTKYSHFNFKGFVAGSFKSEISGVERFGYDRSQPYQKKIKYYDVYQPEISISKPKYYIVPHAWKEVIERLKMNNINFTIAQKNSNVEAEVYYFTEVSHPSRPNNGHFYHRDIDYKVETQNIGINEGDVIVPVNQEKCNYLIELLEPKSDDSFMRWNFFDSRLDHREYFSSWGFEENAMKYLNEHPDFKKQFEKKKVNDKDFANSHYEQMAYIYSETEWKESTYMQYPVYRVLKEIK